MLAHLKASVFVSVKHEEGGIIRNEAIIEIIEVHQSKKSSQLTFSAGTRKIPYDFHFRLQWTYTMASTW